MLFFDENIEFAQNEDQITYLLNHVKKNRYEMISKKIHEIFDDIENVDQEYIFNDITYDEYKVKIQLLHNIINDLKNKYDFMNKINNFDIFRKTLKDIENM